jgi:hypothetical protein
MSTKFYSLLAAVCLWIVFLYFAEVTLWFALWEDLPAILFGSPERAWKHAIFLTAYLALLQGIA